MLSFFRSKSKSEEPETRELLFDALVRHGAFLETKDARRAIVTGKVFRDLQKLNDLDALVSPGDRIFVVFKKSTFSFTVDPLP